MGIILILRIKRGSFLLYRIFHINGSTEIANFTYSSHRYYIAHFLNAQRILALGLTMMV